MTFNVDTRTIPNFISDDEITTINTVIKENPIVSEDNMPPEHGGHHAVTYNFQMFKNPVFDEVKDFILPRLYQHFSENLVIDAAHVLESRRPYGIHTDVMSADYDPTGEYVAAWTFIIPLDDYDSSTIVFNEGDETIKTVRDWIREYGKEPNSIPFNDSMYQEYLTHTPRKDLDYLTIEAIFPWSKGTLFAADRRKFHVSDNYPKRGVECKRGIIIWSSIPKKDYYND